jgi:hypothetical protein
MVEWLRLHLRGGTDVLNWLSSLNPRLLVHFDDFPASLKLEITVVSVFTVVFNSGPLAFVFSLSGSIDVD